MKTIHIADSFYVYPHGIAEDLLSVKANTFYTSEQYPVLTENQMTEVYAQLIAYSKMRWVVGDINTFQKAFEFLEVKAEVARKTISFWDAYQIREVLNTGEEDNLVSRITQLPSNSSIISNSSGSWTENGITSLYYPGDIFVKDYYNRITRIPMISTGFYYPKAITAQSGNTYTITYQYDSTAPNIAKSPDIEHDIPTGTKAAEMSFNVTPVGNENGYNTSFELNSSTTSKSINKITISSIALYPIVKTYLNGELIFDAVTVTSSGNNWVIAKKTNVPTITVTVR